MSTSRVGGTHRPASYRPLPTRKKDDSDRELIRMVREAEQQRNKSPQPINNKSVTPIKGPTGQPPAEVAKFIAILQGAGQRGGEIPVSGAAGGIANMVSDHSYFMRNLFFTQWNSSSAWQGQCVNDVMGVTTALNVLWGVNASYGAFQNYLSADGLRDKFGRADALRDLLTSVFQFLGGAIFVILRPLTIASQILHASWQSVSLLGSFGSGAWGIFYIFLGLWGGYRWKELAEFESAWKREGANPEDAMKFLFSRLQVDAKAKWDKAANAPNGSDPLRQELTFFQNLLVSMGGSVGGLKGKNDYLAKWEQEGLKLLVDQFLAMQDKMVKAGTLTGEKLNSREVATLFTKLFAEVDPNSKDFKELCQKVLEPLGIGAPERGGMPLNALQVFGFAASMERSQKKRDAVYARIMGSDAVAEVHKAHKKGLDLRLQATGAVKTAALDQSRVIIQHAQESLFLKKIYYIAATISGLLGLVISIGTLGVFALSPAGMIAMGVLTIVMMIAMVYIDYKSWNAGMESGQPGKLDKPAALLVATVMTIAVAVTIGLTIAYGMPFIGLTAFVAGMLIGIPSIAFALYGYYKLDQREKRWAEDHPTLDAFEEQVRSQSLQRKELPASVIRCYKRLAKGERRALVEALHRKHIAPVAPGVLEQELEKAAKQTPQFLRACVKTSKIFWKRSRLTGLDKDRNAALALQHLIQTIQNGGTAFAIKDRFDELKKSHKELYQELSKQFALVQKMTTDVALMKTLVTEVRTQMQAEQTRRGQEETELFTRAQQLRTG